MYILTPRTRLRAFHCFVLCLHLLLAGGFTATPSLAAREVVAPPSMTQPTPGTTQATPLLEGAANAVPVLPAVDVTTLNPAQPFPVALSWRLDRTGRLTPEEVLSPAQQSFFAPFNFANMARSAGTCWFRLDLTAYDGSNGQFYLDLNTRVPDQLPSDMRVWLVTANAPPLVLSTETPGLYALPPTFAAATLFVRAAGLPALGFEPVLRSAASITVLDTHGGGWLRLVLAAALLLGLLRGIFEQREWRMWAALYAGALLVADVWGFPASPDGQVRLLDLPGLLAPGVALLLLPHVGRHIMRTREQSALIDFQFIFMGLIGLALTLVPLLSTHVWTVRYLPLWPLGMLLLLPTTLGAMARKIPGAGRFLWISLLPPLGLLVFAPLPAIQFATPESAGWWTSALCLLPAFTLALSSVFIALAPTPKHVIKAKRAPVTVMPGNVDSGINLAGAPLALDPVAAPVQLAPPLILDDSSRMTPPPVADSTLPLHNLERRMRGPLDVLLNEIGALDQLKLPRDMVDHAHRLSNAGRQLALLIGDISSGRHGKPVAIRGTNGMEESAHKAATAAPFDLYEVILRAHNAVAEVAEAKNLALSWFTAPHLARSYMGDGERLARVLTLLAESAVHATDRGIVQIRVQRLPESNDPGQLLFTVSDTGKGAPPLQRSSISLVQVWELVGPCGGTLNVESGPSGTSIAFSLRVQTLGSERAMTVTHGIQEPGLRTTLSSALRILVISDVPLSRQLLTFYLDELPHEVREARSADEALGMYSQAPGALLIFDGDLPENDVVRIVAAIRAFEGERNYPLSSILALVKNDEQMERLRRAGCTHTLLKPVNRPELRQLALRLAPIPKPRVARSETPSTPAPHTASKQEAKQEAKDKKTKRSWSLLPTLQPAKENVERASADLECLKMPSLDVRSNVSDPKPIPRTRQQEQSRTSSRQQPPLPHLPGTDKVASGMPELNMTTPVVRAVTAPIATPERPSETGRAQIVPPSETPPAAPAPLTPSEQVLDDMLREAETAPVASTPLARHAEQTPPERKPIPWNSSTSEASRAASYPPHDRNEWVGEPMPVSTPINRPTPQTTQTPQTTHTIQTPQTTQTIQTPQTATAEDTNAPDAVRVVRRTPMQSTPELPVASSPLAPKARSSILGSLTGLFQKKNSPPADLYTDTQPLMQEWVGEPMPLIKTSEGRDSAGIPSADLPKPAETMPLRVSTIIHDEPAPADESTAEDDFEVPTEEMVLDVQTIPAATSPRDELSPNLDPLSPVMADDPTPDTLNENEPASPTLLTKSPEGGPRGMAPSAPAPVTRLYLPGMEPAQPFSDAPRLDNVPSTDDEIFTLTDVVGDEPQPVSFSDLAPEIDNDNVDDLLLQLDTLYAQARAAFDRNDRSALQYAATQLAQTASALGLHGLIDQALCLEEEARFGTDDTAAALLDNIDESVKSAKM